MMSECIWTNMFTSGFKANFLFRDKIICDPQLDQHVHTNNIILGKHRTESKTLLYMWWQVCNWVSVLLKFQTPRCKWSLCLAQCSILPDLSWYTVQILLLAAKGDPAHLSTNFSTILNTSGASNILSISGAGLPCRKLNALVSIISLMNPFQNCDAMGFNCTHELCNSFDASCQQYVTTNTTMLKACL